MRLVIFVPVLLYPALLVGCHSAFIEATVVNRGNRPVRMLEVDYPSASFGAQALAPGAEYHYRFKVLGTGNLKITYTDASFSEKTFGGPELREGDEGRLTVTVTQAGATWQVDRVKLTR